MAGGAEHVTSIDSSGPAIERAKANVALNGFDAARTAMMDADVNGALRQFHKDGRTFDAIVLDPPKFAPSAAHAIARRVLTKTSTVWLSKFWSPVVCCSPTAARAA